MSETFTIHFEPQGDHLVVTVPEIGATVETAAGETSLDAATDAGRRAIRHGKLGANVTTCVAFHLGMVFEPHEETLELTMPGQITPATLKLSILLLL